MGWDSTATTQDVDIESMSKLMRHFKLRFPPSDNKFPEAIVMTDDCYNALKDQCEKKPFGAPQGLLSSISHIYGVPIEHYPTEEECYHRGFVLWKEFGLKVMIVTTEPQPPTD